jgi:hypothetical protein
VRPHAGGPHAESGPSPYPGRSTAAPSEDPHPTKEGPDPIRPEACDLPRKATSAFASALSHPRFRIRAFASALSQPARDLSPTLSHCSGVLPVNQIIFRFTSKPDFWSEWCDGGDGAVGTEKVLTGTGAPGWAWRPRRCGGAAQAPRKPPNPPREGPERSPDASEGPFGTTDSPRYGPHACAPPTTTLAFGSRPSGLRGAEHGPGSPLSCDVSNFIW